MTTSTKQPKRKPARRAATPPNGGIGRDGHQISQVENSKITIGSPGLLGTLAAIATVIGTVIAGVALDRQGRAAPPPKPSVSNEASATAAPVWARIVNSGPDGVFTYPQAGRGAHYPDGYLDGTVVEVVCQERHGEAVTDEDPAPGQPATWAVWDKLTNGRWIPDMWTTLPKKPGDTPPNGLRTC
ncbi:hypothetical protein OWR29_07895 [Actinoplanes sp. Pm04-4]|uniref:Uncharacterized protein n=1 Tax=Paractinoplanes pyxinae TaxID=2997416 RepID=A0ABT4AUI9_9ACTN|nr:hypothetical protein [Actinoplanes pyxinae]MCY1137916.1 hypothetical protein [Actinoplanes pyxinae]